MNKATLVGVWPSDKPKKPSKCDYDFAEDYVDAIEEYDSATVDRVLDTMGRGVTAIVANHTLGGMSDEAFTLLMDYLSKYDAMLRGEV